MYMQDLDNRIVASRAMTVTVVAIVSVVVEMCVRKKTERSRRDFLGLKFLTQDPCKPSL